MDAPAAEHADAEHILPDGRRLAYRVVGDPYGTPVMYFHGGPGSRLEADLFADAALGAGVRLVATDRPGIGCSDRHRGRTLEQWPLDVASLADELGFQRFSVLGWSEGGPSVLACAAVLPGRVVRALNLAGANYAAVDTREGKSLIGRAERPDGRLGAHLGRGRPATYEILAVTARHAPRSYIAPLRRALDPCDRALLDDAIGWQMVRDARECFRQGTAGLAEDTRLIHRAWSFDVADIRVPVEMWQGADDRLVPVEVNRRIADAMPTATWHELPGEGHLFPLVHAGEIMSGLSAAVARPSSAPS